jgi:2-polyprenyl-6-methoxyphenol hydroxylase-like FAD-dependent oxidoreductase
MRGLDIAVAGCGPAGLASALLLARDGHRVTLFERFDAPRPIGSGLLIQPTGRAILHALGLDAQLLAAGGRIDRLLGTVVPGGQAVLNVRYSWLPGGYCGMGIHRAALFDILHRAVVDAGIAIETGRTVADSIARDGGRALVFADGTQSARFDLVVDCLGASSPLIPERGRPLPYGALWATLAWPDGAGFQPAMLEQRYRRASHMVGVLPIGRRPGKTGELAAFFWSLKGDRLSDWRAAGLNAWKAEVLTLWPETTPFLDQLMDKEQLTFAQYSHRTVTRPAWRALIHIGDSWHSTSPQLGQGANMALLDAYALKAALRETPDIPAALERTVAMRQRHIRMFQLFSRMFTPAYQSDSRVMPFMRDWIIRPFAHLWPATELQAALVTGLMGSPLCRLGLEPVPSSTDPIPAPARTG